MPYRKVPYMTIQAAKSGDAEAMQLILAHYERYIAGHAKRLLYDEYGNCREIVDPEIKQRIEEKLMLGIIYKFDCERLPEGETLET